MIADDELEERLRRIVDEGSASAQPAELADLRAQLALEPDMSGDLPKGTQVNFAEPDLEVAAPPSRMPLTPRAAQPEPMEKVVRVPTSAQFSDEQLQAAQARAADREARSKMAMERGGRELVAGITRTQAQPVTERPTDAFERWAQMQRQKKADGYREDQTRIAGDKVNFDRAEAARKAALDEQRRQQDLDERGEDNDRAERGLAIGKDNAAATRELAGASFAATQNNRKAGDLSDLRKEFNQLPDVKQFGEVDSAYQKVKGAASDPSAAGDLSAIFAYMKMLDPGSSVREGEFANAQNAAGIDQKIIGKYNQIMKGERLSPEQRQDFIRQAEKLYQAHKQRYDVQVQRYRGLASRQGASPDDVITPAAMSRTIVRNPKTGERRYLNDDGSLGEAVK